MEKRLRQLDSRTLRLNRYVDLISTLTREETSAALTQICRELLSMYRGHRAEPPLPNLLWICIDRNPRVASSPPTRSALFVLDIRLDAALSLVAFEQTFVRIAITLLDASSSDLLANGRKHFN